MLLKSSPGLVSVLKIDTHSFMPLIENSNNSSELNLEIN